MCYKMDQIITSYPINDMSMVEITRCDCSNLTMLYSMVTLVIVVQNGREMKNTNFVSN